MFATEDPSLVGLRVAVVSDDAEVLHSSEAELQTLGAVPTLLSQLQELWEAATDVDLAVFFADGYPENAATKLHLVRPDGHVAPLVVVSDSSESTHRFEEDGILAVSSSTWVAAVQALARSILACAGATTSRPELPFTD